MEIKILLYPKPHVVRVPDNWHELDGDEQINYCRDYCSSNDFEFDKFFDLMKSESVERLEKMYGEAK